MNTILIPVDFSEVSRKSMEFAVLLSRKLRLDITVLHVINVPSVAVHSSLVFNSDLPEATQKNAEEQLNEWCSEYSSSEVSCNWIVREGFVVDEIVRVEHELSPDLVILGTTGSTGWIGTLMGSNAVAIMNRVTRPVLLIPHDASVSEFKNILFATQLERVDSLELEKVFRWSRLFGGKVNLIKVDTQYQLNIFNDNHILEELRSTFPNDDFVVYTEAAETTIKGIDHYLESHPTDLVVMTTSHRPFIERLFNASVTRQMAMHTHVPLLVYHYEEK